MRRMILAIALLVLCPLLLVAQDALTNDSVIKMVKAGLSDGLVISAIYSKPGQYNTTVDGMIALKAAGVSDKVVAAVVNRSSGGTAPARVEAAPEAVTPADPNDPTGPHDPGIYMVATDHDGSKKMILIERAGTGREKTANVWGAAFSYGISKAKVKAEIPGPRATVRSTEARPVFYMYFPPTGNLGAADTISSPTQFSLLSLEDKKDHRETTVAKMGLGSAQVGNDDKRTYKFSADKMRPYAYKVQPEEDLTTGEYAFLAATGMGGGASAGSVVVFDFGVDLK